MRGAQGGRDVLGRIPAIGAGDVLDAADLDRGELIPPVGQPFQTTGDLLFQRDFAMHECAVQAARSLVFEAFADADETARRDGAATHLQQQRMRAVTTYATRVVADAARFAYSWAGSAGLRPGVIQRCFRDIHAGSQHIYVDNGTLTGYAQALLAEA